VQSLRAMPHRVLVRLVALVVVVSSAIGCLPGIQLGGGIAVAKDPTSGKVGIGPAFDAGSALVLPTKASPEFGLGGRWMKRGDRSSAMFKFRGSALVAPVCDAGPCASGLRAGGEVLMGEPTAGVAAFTEAGAGAFYETADQEHAGASGDLTVGLSLTVLATTGGPALVAGPFVRTPILSSVPLKYIPDGI